jgi:Ni/Co efflux regulator RcnB
MNKVIVILLAAVFAAAGLTTQKATAQETQEKKEKPAAAAKEARWHGLIIRMNKDASILDVRKGNVEKRIHYDSATKWTEGTKYIEMSEFKEGNDVICFGTYDEKGEFHATRIDLHRR